MTGSTPPTDMDEAGGLPGSDPAQLALEIERDFRNLVEVLDRRIRLLPNLDPETLAEILTIKAAALRGLQLSERLVVAAHGKN